MSKDVWHVEIRGNYMDGPSEGVRYLHSSTLDNPSYHAMFWELARNLTHLVAVEHIAIRRIRVYLAPMEATHEPEDDLQAEG
jgi:hypothetical protein